MYQVQVVVYLQLVLLNKGLVKRLFNTPTSVTKLSQWWPFCFKGGWVGPSCPTRDGLTPPPHPHRRGGKTYAISKAIDIPAWKKIFVVRSSAMF